MTQPSGGSGSAVSALGAFVSALISRERRLLVLSVLLRASGLVAALFGLASLAVIAHFPRPTAAAGLAVLLVGGSFVAIGAPLLRGWRRAGDARRQAALVERLAPALRGRLVTSVERLGGPLPGESAGIVAVVAEEAATLSAAVAPEAVHGGAPVRRAWLGSSALWAAACAVVLLVPGGARGFAAYWAADAATLEIFEQQTVTEAEAPARVGDLTLRYVYPEYTGLEPYEVVNSTGEARAVPGTRVEILARSAQPIESASIVAYDEDPLGAEVSDGRMIRGSFTIGGSPGTYRLLTFSQGVSSSSRAFPITPEADLAPEVTLASEAPVLEVAIDEPLSLSWLARDDFGVRRVAVEIDGKAIEPDLKRADKRTRELSAILEKRPRDLGMKEGGTYELAIAAWDNDSFSGSKAGRSGVVKIIVLGEDGQVRVSAEQRKELLKLLVDVLGDHLEEPYPPGVTAGEYARWGEVLHARYSPTVAFLEGFRTRRGRLVQDFRPAELAVDAGRALIRFTQVTFLPESADEARADAVEMATTLRTEAVATLEEAILSIDRLLRMAAIREVAERVPDLREVGQRLADMLQRPDVRSDELRSVSEEAARLVEELESLTGQLDEGGLKGFIQMHDAELMGLIEEAQRALAAGDRPESKLLLGRTSSALRDLADGIQAELERRQEQAKKSQSKKKDLMAALKELAEKQEALAAEVQAARDELDSARAAQLADMWDKIKAQAAKAKGATTSYAGELRDAGRGFSEVELVSWAESELEEVTRGVDVRDLKGVTQGTDEAQAAWGQYARRFLIISNRGTLPGPGADDIGVVRAEIDHLVELLEVLRRADSRSDPALASRLRAKESEQAALEAELTKLREDAKRVAQESQVPPRGMEESLKQADTRMLQAAEELQAAEGMQALGSQQAAAQHIRDAIESLSDAMKQSQRASDEMQPGQQGEDGEGGGKEGEEGEGGDKEGGDKPGEESNKSGEEGKSQPFELPEPEEFRTPEEYRKALLEGMSGDVPEEYEALKRRYYEELVHQ